MKNWPRASTVHAMAGDIDAAYEELRAENDRLFLKNGEIANTLGAENLKLRALLREAQQYVDDAIGDEDPETQRHAVALVEHIDEALNQ